MRLVIDGDACPKKKEILDLAKTYGIDVILVTSIAHFSDYPNCTYLVVDNEPQAADMAIANCVQKDDIVITGDYGLAALLIAKAKRVVSQRGKLFTEENIDGLLLQRHLVQKRLRSGGKVKGPTPYTRSDQERLLSLLKRIFEQGN